MINLLEKLPQGAITEIARKANVHYTTAHATLKGNRSNSKVIKALNEYLEERKKANDLAKDILG